MTRTVLDGSAVEIDSSETPADVFTGDVMTLLRPFGNRRQRFAAGPRDFALRTAFDPDIAVGLRFEEEFVYDGGRVKIGWGNQPIGPDGADYWEVSGTGVLRRKPFRILTWEGSAYSMYAHTYGRESTDLIQALTQFHIQESPSGLSCIPKAPSATPFIKGPTIMELRPTIGLLYIRELTTETAKTAPKHSGTRVKGGELFIARQGQPDMYFVLVGSSSITQIEPEEGFSSDEVLVRIEDLVVTWRRVA